MEVDLDRLYDNNVKIVELRQSTDSDKELLLEELSKKAEESEEEASATHP